MGQERPGDVHQPGDVGGDLTFDLLGRGRLERPDCPVPRIVHKDIDRTEMGDSPVHRSLDTLAICDIQV